LFTSPVHISSGIFGFGGIGVGFGSGSIQGVGLSGLGGVGVSGVGVIHSGLHTEKFHILLINQFTSFTNRWHFLHGHDQLKISEKEKLKFVTSCRT